MNPDAREEAAKKGTVNFEKWKQKNVDVQVQRTAGTGSLTATFRAQLEAVGGSAPAASASLAATGGTGGIVVDNTAGNGGSQIYYSTLTSPGNAVQASQAGLN